MAKNKVTVKIEGKETVSPASKKASKSLKVLKTDSDKAHAGMQKGAAGSTTSLKKFAIGAAAAAAAVAGIIKIGKDLIAAYAIQEQAEARLNAALISTGEAAGLSFYELTKMASGLQEVTKFGDEAVIASQALLLTFTRVGRDVFPAAQKAILNVSEAMGQDLRMTTIQIGKALNDPIRNMGALGRMGIQLSKDQTELVKSFADVNDMASAQKIILGELQTQFGGMAEAAAATATGGMEQLKNQISDLKEELGEFLAIGLTPIVDKTRGVVGILSSIITYLPAMDALWATLYAVDDKLKSQAGRAYAEDWEKISIAIDLADEVLKKYSLEMSRGTRESVLEWKKYLQEHLSTVEKAHAKEIELKKEYQLQTAGILKAEKAVAKLREDALTDLEKQLAIHAKEELYYVAVLKSLIDYGLYNKDVYNMLKYHQDEWHRIKAAIDEAAKSLADFVGAGAMGVDIGFGTGEGGLGVPTETGFGEGGGGAFGAESGFGEGITTNLDLFKEGLTDTTLQMSGFAGQVMKSVATMGPLGLIYEALKPVIFGIFQVLSPVLDTILLPLLGRLVIMGRFFGTILKPVFDLLAQVTEKLGEAFVWLYNKVFRHIGNLLIGIFNTAHNVIAAFINMVIGFLNLFRSEANKKAYIEYKEKGEGHLEEINYEDLLGAGQSYLDTTGYGDGNGGAGDGIGSRTTVQHVPDIYITINVHGNVIGEGGKEQVGEYVVDAITAHLGTGAKVEWLEAD